MHGKLAWNLVGSLGEDGSPIPRTWRDCLVACDGLSKSDVYFVVGE